MHRPMQRNTKSFDVLLANQCNYLSFQELLQTHRSAYNRLGKVQSSGNVLTHKQGYHNELSMPRGID